MFTSRAQAIRGRRTPPAARAAIALGLAAAILLACGRAPVKQDAPPPARRIVSLAPNLTEILFALGLGDRVVGVTDYCDYPPEAAAKPRVGGYVNPNLETIVALAPDLAVATPNVGNRDAVLKLQSVGIDFLIVDTPSIEALGDAIRRIAARAGEPERGERLVASLAAGIEEIRVRHAAEPRARALLVFSHDPLIVAGPGTLFDQMLEAAGGGNLAPGSGPFPHMSLEQVVRLDPEVIVDTAMTSGGAADARFWGRLGTLAAVERGRICAPPSDPILRPGPRIVEGIRLLADCLHPAAGATP